MNVVETNIPGVKIIENTAFQDNRGAFSRLYCARELKEVIGSRSIVQINHSLTHSIGAVRGLHYQNTPNAEMKIVRCLKGRVLDVAVDLRQGSPTFLKWSSIELTAENHLAFVIPEGCAHGFQVLEKDSELLYLHTEFYSQGDEGGVRYDDPKFNINWPLAPTDLSARDVSHPYLTNDFKGIIL
jgi:dTDP-4-dehydrorhamnose 3,5-epimerase